MQRQYREKEGECFNTLRDVIKEVSGDEIHTRQEILRKGCGSLSYCKGAFYANDLHGKRLTCS